jgi:anti-sigma factor RsiW
MRLSCWYMDRHLIRYVDGELATQVASKVEGHLLICGRCRGKLLDLRIGRKLALMLPMTTPREESWRSIESAMDLPRHVGRTKWRRSLGLRRPLSRPVLSSALMLVLGAALMAAVLLVMRGGSERIEHTALPAGVRFNAKSFHPVAIDDIQRSDDPHVVAEGYVANVSVDSEDGDLTFRLVDRLDRPGPFVICEIMDWTTLSPPAVGTRVRVYGVSRYDAKADHQWYEVHPVLDIEPASK